MNAKIIINPDVGMLIPDNMVEAARALKAIGAGDGTLYDVAELMLAANAADPTGDLVGAAEIERAVRMAELERQEARARGDSETAHRHALKADELHTRWQAVLRAKIPAGSS